MYITQSKYLKSYIGLSVSKVCPMLLDVRHVQLLYYLIMLIMLAVIIKCIVLININI